MSIEKTSGPNAHLSSGSGKLPERKTHSKSPQHSTPSAPVSQSIAQGAVEALKREQDGVSVVAQQLDQGVQQRALENAEALASITRSLMPRTLTAFSQNLQENPGEGAAIAAMFLEGVAALPTAGSALPGHSVSQSLSASAEARAMPAIAGSDAEG
jgi:hypothetical protein